MARDELDDLDEMVAKRAKANPDFPRWSTPALAARVERRAKLEAANEGAPNNTEEDIDEILARRDRGSDPGAPS